MEGDYFVLGTQIASVAEDVILYSRANVFFLLRDHSFTQLGTQHTLWLAERVLCILLAVLGTVM